MYFSEKIKASYLRLKHSKARAAFIDEELNNSISHQLRILREERGWSQSLLAKKLKTTQAAVSRLEDATYGRYSLATLKRLGEVFEIALQVRFQSFGHYLMENWDTSPDRYSAPPYSIESQCIDFFRDSNKTPTTSFPSVAFAMGDSDLAVTLTHTMSAPAVAPAYVVIENNESTPI